MTYSYTHWVKGKGIWDVTTESYDTLEEVKTVILELAVQKLKECSDEHQLFSDKEKTIIEIGIPGQHPIEMWSVDKHYG